MLHPFLALVAKIQTVVPVSNEKWRKMHFRTTMVIEDSVLTVAVCRNKLSLVY